MSKVLKHFFSVINTKTFVVIAAACATTYLCTKLDFHYNVPTDLIHEWYKDAMHTLDVSTNYFNKQYYPADFTACNNYGGCRFKEVCSASPSRRNLFLDNDFDKEPHPDLKEEYAKAI